MWISAKSGKRVTENTPREWVRKELFIAGTEPKEYDDAFVEATVCAEAPERLYDPACGCTPEKKWFLSRSVPEVSDPRYLPLDLSLSPPRESCLGVSSWVYGSPPSDAQGEPLRATTVITFHSRGVEPEEISLAAGQPQEFLFRAADRGHRLEIAELGWGLYLPPGQAVRVRLELPREGVYFLRCLEHGEKVRIVGRAREAGAEGSP